MKKKDGQKIRVRWPADEPLQFSAVLTVADAMAWLAVIQRPSRDSSGTSFSLFQIFRTRQGLQQKQRGKVRKIEQHRTIILIRIIHLVSKAPDSNVGMYGARRSKKIQSPGLIVDGSKEWRHIRPGNCKPIFSYIIVCSPTSRMLL